MTTPTGVHEREEVFYTIPLQSRRRHSVGGYLAAGGLGGLGEVTKVPSEVPSMPPPKFRHKGSEEEVIKRKKPKNLQFRGKFFNRVSNLNVLYSYNTF